MVAIWLTAPRTGFVLTVACGIIVLVAHVILFWRYTREPDPLLCQIALAPDGSTLDEVMARARRTLYGAKRAGRNCVIGCKRTCKADPVRPALRSE